MYDYPTFSGDPPVDGIACPWSHNEKTWLLASDLGNIRNNDLKFIRNMIETSKLGINYTTYYFHKHRYKKQRDIYCVCLL